MEGSLRKTTGSRFRRAAHDLKQNGCARLGSSSKRSTTTKGQGESWSSCDTNIDTEKGADAGQGTEHTGDGAVGMWLGQWTRGQEACWPVRGGTPCQGNSPAGVCWGLCPRTAPLSELGSELERPRKTPSVSHRACPSAWQGSVSGRSAPQGTSDLAGHAGHRMAVMQAAAATRAGAALCLCTAAMRRLP